MAQPGLNESLDLMLNGSIFRAVNVSYTTVWGAWFWPLIFFAFLGLVVLSTKNPAFTAAATIIGNVSLVFLLGAQLGAFFYLILILSIGMTLYKFYGSVREA